MTKSKTICFLSPTIPQRRSPPVQNTLSLAADIIPLSWQPLSYFSPMVVLLEMVSSVVCTRNLPYFSILSSSKLDEVALDGDQRLGSSPFAYYIAEALRGPSPDLDMDSFLSLEELHHYIYPRVVANTLSVNTPPLLAVSFTICSLHAQERSPMNSLLRSRNTWKLFLIGSHFL